MHNITTRELDELTEILDYTYHTLNRSYPCGDSRRNPRIHLHFQECYQDWIRDLHRHYKPAARPYAWPTVMQVLSSALLVMRMFYPEQENDELHGLRSRIATLCRRIATLETENASRRDAIAAQPQSTSVVVPKREIKVTNKTEQGVLYLIGHDGLGRSWLITERVSAMYNVGTRTVENSFTALVKRGLIKVYSYKGDHRGYRYKPRGKRRKLYVLSDDGCTWYQQAYSEEPATSEFELGLWVSRHKGVEHAVDILEARDLLRRLGLKVDDDPKPLLATDDPRGKRTEPDLLLHYQDETWPVEVQREVHRRNDKKWEKALTLSGGHLVLILETVTKQERQEQLLRNAAWRLTPGRVLLSNLEYLRATDEVVWSEVITGRR